MLSVKVPRAELPQRESLADAVCDWVLEHGVNALSLRPLASDLGISTYPLHYWFGSKTGVIVAALERSEQRQLAMVARWAEEDGAVLVGDLFRRYWAWSTSPTGRPYLRLFVELVGLAQRSPELRPYVERAIVPWRELIERSLTDSGRAPDEARSQTTLLAATVAGLQMDLATSGAVKRTTQAAETLASQLEEIGRLPLPPPETDPRLWAIGSDDAA